MRAHFGGAIAALAIFTGLAVLVWRVSFLTPEIGKKNEPTFKLPTSQRLDPSMFVKSDPQTVNLVRSSIQSFSLVETGSSGELYRELSDDELLALLAGHPVALVRHGPSEAELVF